ncbi:hypothetical protein ACFFWD_36065 [Bradyrhizobium erythrophlei]|uniref:hypothetical protein n=1 Tax=Bradyrhizobium erythrophlei TaxID=1437360 RepID=UPI0035E4A39D
MTVSLTCSRDHRKSGQALWRLKEVPTSDTSTSNTSVTLQILLRREWRTPGGIAKVLDILRANGLTPTTSGVATVSAAITQEKFEEMFGVKAAPTAPQPPGNTEFGRASGHVSPELKVPAPFAEWVESISVAPGHSYY